RPGLRVRADSRQRPVARRRRRSRQAARRHRGHRHDDGHRAGEVPPRRDRHRAGGLRAVAERQAGARVAQGVRHRPARPSRAAGVARTFQLVRPFPGLTALENVLVGRLYGRARTTTAEALNEGRRLLRVLGLEARANEPAARLTLIDRKRLELARALATSPRLLLLDEFMAGLNPMETATAMELVRDLIAAGVTVLMVEHIVWALMDLARRIVVLSAGEKI